VSKEIEMGNKDILLMFRFKNGDISAFDELVQRHKKPLMNFFYRFFWDYQLSEDSCQEVFYRLFKSIRKYKPTSKFNTFFYRIAKNYLYDQLRKKKIAPHLISLDQPVPNKNGNSVSLHEKIADTKSNPRKELEKKEISYIIKEAIFALPLKSREVFVLCEDQGLKYEDAAKILGIPVGTVKSRMYKAMSILKENLKRLKGE
jgi:RNA polymerase sigma-70 factor (ECF subfamily)